MKKLKIGVVGGGIFGVTTSVRLAQEGHIVDLYEKNDDILMAASGINQYRLHGGYHYPRSVETALSSKNSVAGFKQEYAGAILGDCEHYYCISKTESLVSADEYVAFCDDMKLEFTRTWTNLVNQDTVDLCVKVKENLFDAKILREICWQRLLESNVSVRLNTEANEAILSAYEFIVVCTYANINSFLGKFPEAQADYQFELCEKPVVRLPNKFNRRSIVILDGPFMCVDPLGRSGLFVLGNVVHAIHQTNIGAVPIINDVFRPCVNNGIIKDPPMTKFNQFIRSGARFIPDLRQAEHVGSMFTIRTVVPYKDETDERPTIVEKVSDRIITVFSGKIGTCVEAAEEVVKLIGGD